MRQFVVVFLAIGLIAVNGSAQTAPSTSTEIHQLYLDDQADRGVVPAGTKPPEVTSEQMSAHDSVRRKRANQLLEQGVLKTGADFHDAAFIFQHGDKSDDYLLAHVLAMMAVNKGDPRGRWIAAATLDRYLQAIGQSQVFGTQYVTRGYIEFLDQIKTKQSAAKAKTQSEQGTGQSPSMAQPALQESKPAQKAAAPDDQDAKKWEEYLQEPYNSSLISDSLRAQYCVPGIDDQKARLVELNGGKPAANKPIPGCSK